MPNLEEADACSGFLKLQLKIINPKFIVCLGNVAAQNLLKTDESIGRLRGQWYEYKDGSVESKVLCTYHPAYLLRNPEAKKDVFEDLQMLINTLNEIQTMA